MSSYHFSSLSYCYCLGDKCTANTFELPKPNLRKFPAAPLATKPYCHGVLEWILSGKSKVITIITTLIIWALWESRNAAKHKGIKQKAGNIVRRVIYIFKSISGQLSLKEWKGDLNMCTLFEVERLRENRRQAMVVEWIKPIEGCLKINVDGASKGTRGHGGGGIVRDRNGNVMFAFGCFYGSCTSLEAELRALEQGLQWCIANNVKNIFIASDSLKVGNFICKSSYHWSMSSRIVDLKSLLEKSLKMILELNAKLTS